MASQGNFKTSTIPQTYNNTREHQFNQHLNISGLLHENQFTSASQESLSLNPTDPQKVIRYLLNDKTNVVYHSQQNTQRLDNQYFGGTVNRITPKSGHSQQQQVSRSKSALGLDKTFTGTHDQHSLLLNVPSYTQFVSDMSKSMDLQNPVSPTTALLQSCLTFQGDNENQNLLLDGDMNFLTQAMQPDKIFDLPMALLKVQKALQNSNANALKLKEALEMVLQREQKLQEKYSRLKKDNQQMVDQYEQQAIDMKKGFKEQLMQFTQSVSNLQNEVQERDVALQKLKEQMNQLYQQNQDLKGQCEIKNDKINILENQKETLQGQINRKAKDFEELRQQFNNLLQQESQSSQELDNIQKRAFKEEQKLKSIIEEKNLLLQVSKKELDCAKQEKRLAEEQSEKLFLEIQRIKSTMKEDLERRYLDAVEYIKRKEKECEELRVQLNTKSEYIKDLERKYEKTRNEQEKMEEQLMQIRKDITKINNGNREALVKQKDGFEQRMKEMEDEVTKVSLNRYKIELEAKQKLLKISKKYDEQLREMRHFLGYVLGRIGVTNLPEFLKEDLAQSISEVRIQSKDFMRALQEFDHIMYKIREKNSFNSETQNWKNQYEQLLKAYKSELLMRRGLHNQLQELKGSIRVLCRIRPLMAHEYRGRKKSNSVKILNQHQLLVNNETGSKEQLFQFDRVFEPTADQGQVSEEVQQLVVSCLDGFNVCIMAYGQTGSGKTYTMIGDDDNPGLYFSSVDELFLRINERKKVIDYEIGVSIVEIYNETLRDLLSKKGQQAGQQIRLRDNGDGETCSDQIVKQVKSKNQILQCLREACMNRTVGVTHYNEQSSRSHFILTLYVTGRHKETKDVYKGRLNLIDLAGSERILKSQAEGDRVKEALNINQSLTTLGKVFLALLNKANHVPYRDSKLTHYLKDSLGGESKTMLIVQVSPNMNDYGETLSSLTFGQRVACIEKGQIRATIESPNKPIAPSMFTKRSKSQNRMEYQVHNRSITPQHHTYSGMNGTKITFNQD